MKIPMRECAACHGRFEKKQLIRIVRTPDGTVALDERGKVSGKGVYICKNEQCLNKAIKSKAFSRALEVPVPESVTEEIRALIEAQNNG